MVPSLNHGFLAHAFQVIIYNHSVISDLKPMSYATDMIFSAPLNKYQDDTIQ
jgi:hypothetical protein